MTFLQCTNAISSFSTSSPLLGHWKHWSSSKFFLVKRALKCSCGLYPYVRYCKVCQILAQMPQNVVSIECTPDLHLSLCSTTLFILHFHNFQQVYPLIIYSTRPGRERLPSSNRNVVVSINLESVLYSNHISGHEQEHHIHVLAITSVPQRIESTINEQNNTGTRCLTFWKLSKELGY